MAKQIIKRITSKDKNIQKKGIAINKSSIGYIWVNGKRYGYNIEQLPNNRIDFEQIEKNQSPKRIIYMRRK